MHRAQNKRKVPLERKDQVNHVFEGHWINVSILETFRVT